jgi:hypothetical protein
VDQPDKVKNKWLIELKIKLKKNKIKNYNFFFTVVKVAFELQFQWIETTFYEDVHKFVTNAQSRRDRDYCCRFFYASIGPIKARECCQEVAEL